MNDRWAVKRRVDNVGILLLLAILTVVVAFLAVPVAVAVAMSFDSRTYLGAFPPPDLSLQWYSKLWSSSYYLKGLQTSLIVAVLATTISTVAGATCAFVLNRYRFPGREALGAFFLSPLVVPAVVLGFALLLVFSALGISDGLSRLVAGHVIITVPYTIRTTLASLSRIPRSLAEAALSLGATERGVFWEITLPLARTGVFAGAVLAFAFSMDDVAVSLFLTDPTSYTLPVALISMMRGQFDMTIAAAAVMLVVLTTLLIIVLDRLVGLERIIGQGLYRS